MTLHQMNDKARDFVESMNESERRREILPLSTPPREPRGVFSWKVVRTVLFATVSLAIVCIGAASILAVWDLLNVETAWRISLTFAISVISLTLFAAANESFADKLGTNVPRSNDEPPSPE
jgi:hypothetical protein